MAVQMTEMWPAIVAAFDHWDAGGRVGPMPVPSMQGSNSRDTSRVSPANATVGNAMVTPPAYNAAPEVLATPQATIVAPEVSVTTPAANTVARAQASSHH